MQHFFHPKKSRVSWAEAADGRQAHKENSESCTSLKLQSAQLCTFSVSLKVWFHIRSGVLLQLWSYTWKSCCIDKSLFVCRSLTLKSIPPSAQQTLCPTASFKLKAQTIPDNWTFWKSLQFPVKVKYFTSPLSVRVVQSHTHTITHTRNSFCHLGGHCIDLHTFPGGSSNRNMPNHNYYPKLDLKPSHIPET